MTKPLKHKSSLERAVRKRLDEMHPQRNLTWLASQLGICVETLRNWFEEPRKVKAMARIALAQVLGVPLEELFEEVKEPAEIAPEAVSVPSTCQNEEGG